VIFHKAQTATLFGSAPGQWQIDCMAEPTSNKFDIAAQATAAVEQRIAH
jgi:hypothetical protein